MNPRLFFREYRKGRKEGKGRKGVYESPLRPLPSLRPLRYSLFPHSSELQEKLDLLNNSFINCPIEGPGTRAYNKKVYKKN